MRITFLIYLLFFSYPILSQPSTEIYLFDLKNEKSLLTLSIPTNISNNAGYDNQPSFWADGKSLLYARTIKGQTDIARYFIKSGKTNIISKTFQGSEYSPLLMPDKKHISSIRLDTTGLQLLYKYDLKGMEQVLVPDLVIGYHTWINDDLLASFVLGDPATLQLINILTGNSKVIGKNIGRSLHKIPKRDAFSYIDKSIEPWQIVSMDPKSFEKQVLVPTVFNSEDYAWLSSNQIITGHNGILYTLTIGDKQWKSAFDVSVFGIIDITRIAVSPNGSKLAIVSK